MSRPSDVSVVELAGDLVEQTQSWLQAEILRVRCEIAEAKRAAIWGAVAGVAALTGLQTLVAAFVLGLTRWTPLTATFSATVVGFVSLGVAGWAARRAAARPMLSARAGGPADTAQLEAPR